MTNSKLLFPCLSQLDSNLSAIKYRNNLPDYKENLWPCNIGCDPFFKDEDAWKAALEGANPSSWSCSDSWQPFLRFLDRRKNEIHNELYTSAALPVRLLQQLEDYLPKVQALSKFNAFVHTVESKSPLIQHLIISGLHSCLPQACKCEAYETFSCYI